MKTLKSSGPRDQPPKRVVLCPQSENLLQALKRLSLRRDLWVLDSQASECFLCSQRFSPLRRRHHCRMCGQVFCRKCTLGSIELYSSSVRCCNSCLAFLQVTSEEDTLLVLRSKLNQADKGTKADDDVEEHNSFGSDSDDSDPAELLDKALERVESGELAEQVEGSLGAGSFNALMKPHPKELNAQLYVKLTLAKDLPVTQDCGVYCLLSLGRQQVRTITCKGVSGLTRTARWAEGFYFDVTHEESSFTVSVWAEYLSHQATTAFLGETTIPVTQLMTPVPKPVDRELRLKNKSGGSGGNATLFCNITYTTVKAKLVPDDFHYLTVLGRGNFGKVMQVKKKDTGRIYAMKILNKETVVQNDAVQHTIAERNVLRRVHHPFIVSLKFSFQTEDKLYLVLDYLCGGELFTHLSNVDHFSEWRTKFYAAQIVMALGHLHELEVIYRDLKPENLMLDMDGYVCLTDFGLVKEGVAWDEKTSTYCGSPEYLAPEIILGKPYGKAVDWWALGTFIYEMLSGWPPFFDENHKIMNRRILNDQLVFDPKLFSRDACSLLRGLLDRDPERRLGSGPMGTQDIKNHPFFSDIDWDKLYNRQIEPPFKPHLRNILDTKFFSEEFTGESVKESFVESHLSKTYQEAFRGFSWVAPTELDKYPVSGVSKRRRSRPPMNNSMELLPSPVSSDREDSADWSPFSSGGSTPVTASPGPECLRMSREKELGCNPSPLMSHLSAGFSLGRNL